MSIDYNTHVGPYIQVYNPKKPSTKEYHSCPDKKCFNYGSELSNKFCPNCGRAIILVTFPCTAATDFDIYEEKMDNDLSEIVTEWKPDGMESCMLFVSNRKGFGKSYDARSDCYVSECNETTVVADVQRFITTFGKQIVRLKEVFGEKNVQIKWGVIGWAS